MTARDRGHIEEIINHLKRVENDYRINLTPEMEWLRGLTKQEPVTEDLEEACDSYYDETWDEHGGRAMVVDGCHDIWFPSHATDDFFKAGAKWQKAKDESTTEDLGEYINELSKQFPEVSFAKLSRIAVRVANWQKEQYEKNRLKHCDSISNEQADLEQKFIDQHLDNYNRMPTFLDAIEYGMSLKEEQMMKGATDVTVHIEAGNYPYIPQIELYDYDKDIPLAKEGDKYKMILIKED